MNNGHHNSPLRRGSDLPLSTGQNPNNGSRSLTVSTAIMMFGLLLSKLTGQLREILIMPVFGGNPEITDAYIIGFQVPDLFFQLLVGGAIQAAITPFLAASLERGAERRAWRSLSVFINYAAVIMVVASAFGIIVAPWLVPLLNAGKSELTVNLAVKVTQALFPQVFFMMMAALCIGILNAYKRFTSTSFGPAVYNIAVILAMVTLGAASPLGAVRTAVGVTIAALIYFLLQFFLARSMFRNYRFSFNRQDSGFRKLVKRALPTLFSGSIIQLNTIILNSFAFQFAGAATMLRQASTTWQLPYGIFTVAIGNVMLPSLSRNFAAGDDQSARRLLTQSIRRALFLVVPAAAVFFFMPHDTIAAIFQWGSSYTDAFAAQTAEVLRFYCIAMVAHTFVFLTNQAFYSRGQTRIALVNGILTLFLNTLLCYLFTSFTGLGVASLSLAYTITSVFSALFLSGMYRLNRPQAVPRGISRYMLSLLFCVLPLAAVVLGLELLPVDPEGKAARLLWYAVRALAGLTAYAAAAVVVGLPEMRQMLGKLLRRLVRR